MYSFRSRVRYSETDRNGFLTLEGILDYFQDASTFHSEELGLGIQYLKQNKLLWVLSAWQIVVERYPKLGEAIRIVTFPYEFRGFLGFRNFYLEDESGSRIAYANSVWTLMDLEAGRPVRPLPEMVEKYILSDKLEMEYAPRKISTERAGKKMEPVTVKKYHLDSNSHVNNGQYVRMAMEQIPEDCRVRQLRAEYKKSALLNDIIVPVVSEEGERYLVELKDGKNGEPFAVVELAIAIEEMV